MAASLFARPIHINSLPDTFAAIGQRYAIGGNEVIPSKLSKGGSKAYYEERKANHIKERKGEGAKDEVEHDEVHF